MSTWELGALSANHTMNSKQKKKKSMVRENERCIYTVYIRIKNEMSCNTHVI